MSLDDGSSVATQDRHEDDLQPITGRTVADSTTIQAVVDKSFDDFYGPDTPTDPLLSASGDYLTMGRV